MSKFLYPIYKLNIESYKKWWLYHKKAGGSGILSEILQGFSFNLENTLNRKFKLFEIEGNSVQDGSPSPDNEVPILSSGDNENLVNESNINFIYSSVNKVIYDNGLIKTIKSPNGQFYEFDEPLQSGETYTLTFKFVQGRVNVQGSQDFSIGMYHSGNNNSWQGNLTKTQIANIDLAGKTFTLTHKATDTITGLYIFIYSSPTFVTPLWFNVKVEKGNKATPYSPYGMGSINEKIQTRNLFNKNEITENYRLISDGTLYADNSYVTSDYIKILSNTKYVFNSMVGSECICEYDKNKNCTGRTIMSSGSSITTKADTYYVRISVQKSKLDIFQFEQGTTATPYVPHEEQDYSIFVQQPFRSIGDVRDCFVKKDGNWYERHPISRYIFTGEEDFIIKNIEDKNILFQLDFSFAKNNSEVLCNNFKKINNIWANDIEGIEIADKKLRIRINKKSLTDITTKDKATASFKSYLAERYANGKPVYVQYLLEEPLDLPCTETQIEQLENKPSTYKDFTIINSEDETKAHLKIQYYKEG